MAATKDQISIEERITWQIGQIYYFKDELLHSKGVCSFVLMFVFLVLLKAIKNALEGCMDLKVTNYTRYSSQYHDSFCLAI